MSSWWRRRQVAITSARRSPPCRATLCRAKSTFAQVTSQCIAFVLGAEQAALLQDWYDGPGQGFHCAGRCRRHHYEAVAAICAEDIAHPVCDVFGRSHDLWTQGAAGVPARGFHDTEILPCSRDLKNIQRALEPPSETDRLTAPSGSRPKRARQGPSENGRPARPERPRRRRPPRACRIDAARQGPTSSVWPLRS